MACTMFSIGSLTSCTASSAVSPEALIWISTSGTEIRGSSSRGRLTSAISPTASAAKIKSGVNGEVMNARVSPPASPRPRPLSPCSLIARHHHVAGPEAGQDLDHFGAINIMHRPRHDAAQHRAALMRHVQKIKPRARDQRTLWHQQGFVFAHRQTYQNPRIHETRAQPLDLDIGDHAPVLDQRINL